MSAGVGGVVLLAHPGRTARAAEKAWADVLRAHGLATWRVEMPEPGPGGVELLGSRIGHRLGAARCKGAAQHSLGLLGADTGAVAALRLAARWPGCVGAVVALDGGFDGDLDCSTEGAAPWLAQVFAPTLLVVVGADAALAESNRRAMRLLGCNKRLEIVPGAAGAMAEPGARASAAELAAAWFVRHLGRTT